MLALAWWVALFGRIDVARAAATIYTATLLATVAIGATALAAFAARKHGAQARSLVWRAAIAGMLLVFVGRQLPLHWIAWVVPSTLAAPLVALGRAQMVGSFAAPASEAAAAPGAIAIVAILLAIYVIGVVAVLRPTIVDFIARRRRLVHATRVEDGTWTAVLDEVRAALGLSRRVRLYVDDGAAVPVTWGLIDPVIVLPPVAHEWDDAQRRIVMLHELAHVGAGDWAFTVAARLVCALYWFHPGAWWVARELHDDCELACDDRVIASGVRRSDYAELLVSAANSLLGDATPIGAALALSERSGLRGRLAAVLDARHDVRPLWRGWAVVVTALTLGLACPMSAVQLAPTRDVLTTLMQDARWESRAYAVLGLAQRPDSIAVARSAAERDPSPRVRAWARYALGEQAERPDVRTIIHD
jgi:beta-lactamase regulating signal transducer with metallopeptidase domain